jgi:hypothetical protein
MSLSRPGKIYNSMNSKPSDACFNADFTEYCTHFAQSKDGQTICQNGGEIDKHAVNVLSTLSALPLCNSDVPKCSAQRFVLSGTTEQCSDNNIWKQTP